MSPPDGDRSNRLPTLSWESVVAGDTDVFDRESATDTDVVSDSDSDTEAVSDDVIAAPVLAPTVSPEEVEPFFTTLSLRSSVPDSDPPLLRTTRPSLIVTADDLVTPDPNPEPGVEPEPEPMPESELEPEPAPVAALESVADAQAEPEAEPEPVSSVGSFDEEYALPVIVEATPSAGITTTFAVLDEPAVIASGPFLPSVPQPAPRPAPMVDHQAFESPMSSPAPATRRRKKSRRGPKLLLTLVVLGALVAAGIIVGKPYLFPDDWDARTEPYAVAVETTRGVEFAEPLSVIDEPAAVIDARYSSGLLETWSNEQPMWRALGLSNGAVDEQTVAALLAGWRTAAYSTDDGQVYVDDGSAGAEVDAAIMMAMSDASLDQQFGWSPDQPARTLDGAATTAAAVRRQSRDVQQDSEFASTVAEPSLAVLSYAPPVLGYRVLAPELFAEFAGVATDGRNPLAQLDENGPGLLPPVGTTVASGPVLIDGDVALTSPRPLDRSFWYLALAGYLDMPVAYSASESIVENAVVTADRGGVECVYSTFGGGDLIQTATLRDALQTWSATAPVEFASSFSVLGDGSLQLVTCDPGVGFGGASRFGVARELASWRLAELATAEQTVGALDPRAAWSQVAASNAVADLVSLPADTPPADMAAAARAAVTSVLTPTG